MIPAIYRYQPGPGQIWRSMSNGNEYRVVQLANLFSDKPEYPPTVFYVGPNEKFWAKTLSRWMETMEPVVALCPKTGPIAVDLAGPREQVRKMAYVHSQREADILIAANDMLGCLAYLKEHFFTTAMWIAKNKMRRAVDAYLETSGTRDEP